MEGCGFMYITLPAWYAHHLISHKMFMSFIVLMFILKDYIFCGPHIIVFVGIVSYSFYFPVVMASLSIHREPFDKTENDIWYPIRSPSKSRRGQWHLSIIFYTSKWMKRGLRFGFGLNISLFTRHRQFTVVVNRMWLLACKLYGESYSETTLFVVMFLWYLYTYML